MRAGKGNQWRVGRLCWAGLGWTGRGATNIDFLGDPKRCTFSAYSEPTKRQAAIHFNSLILYSINDSILRNITLDSFSGKNIVMESFGYT